MAIYVTATSSITVPNNTTSTILQMSTGSGYKSRVLEFGVSFDGTNVTTPAARVVLARQNTSIGGTNNTLSNVKYDPDDPDDTSTTFRYYVSDITEPTTNDALGSWFISHASGLLVVQFPYSREIVVDESAFIGIRVVMPNISGVNVTTYIVYAR